ncbi:hypothetical protein [Novosphingobium sp. B1]|jgi:hypothetical protein|uniref:hypothetical protein n=1 Tax=Novosphingobium sp. B1 TaxID=1938756 RepID=UPI0009D8F931|nr:hypothetical protein [Novosphingobium sp. B1]SMC49619.1 hypothetical protein SAMN06272759_103324 [Novosphingobium sp. B1]
MDIETDNPDAEAALSRPQRRLLRRIYNGRTVPIEVDGKPFLTFKDASRYLLALAPDEREAAYLQMRAQAK